MKVNKFIIVLLITCIIFFFVTNISSINTMDNSAFVIALGFDVSENNEMNLTFQIATPYNADKENSSQSISTKEITVGCNTINEGIIDVNNYLSKKINLSYMKAVVFSKEFTQKGINNYVSTLINNVEVRPYASIFISKCNADYFIKNSKPILEKSASKYYNLELSSEKNTSQIQNVTLLDFYNSFYDDFVEQYATLSDIVKVTEDENHIQNLGMAILRNGKYIGEIDRTETLCNMILTNKFINSTITIEDPIAGKGYISQSLNDAKSKIHVDISNNSPIIYCNIVLNSRLLTSNMNTNYLNPDNSKKIEEYTEIYMKNIIENFLYKTSLNLNSDIAGFARYGIKNFKTISEWNNYNWNKHYNSCIFKVSVKCHLKSSYIITEVN